MATYITAVAPAAATAAAPSIRTDTRMWAAVYEITRVLCQPAYVRMHAAGYVNAAGRVQIPAADAQRLGHALAEQIAAGAAQNVIRDYCAYRGWDAQLHTADTMAAAYMQLLRQFSEFLVNCGGYDIG